MYVHNRAFPNSSIFRGENMIKEFREFAMRGNVVDLAVGVIIGAAFGAIVNSLVTDIIMPVCFRGLNNFSKKVRIN